MGYAADVSIHVLRTAAGDDDLAAIVGIERDVDPTFGDTTASVRAADATLIDSGWTVVRSVAIDESVVGHAAARQLPTAVDGATYVMRVAVAGERRRSGVGTALHHHAVAGLPDPAASTLFGYVPDGGGVAFAERLGYRRAGRAFVAAADPRTVEERTPPAGIRIEALTALMARRPEWFELLYGLFLRTIGDAPFPIEEHPTPPDVFRARVIDAETADPDAILVAIDDDEWVGYTTLRRAAAGGGRWSQMFTGVLASHRGRGIATSLKRSGLVATASKSATLVETMNHESNLEIRAINERLGFTTTGISHLMIRRP